MSETQEIILLFVVCIIVVGVNVVVMLTFLKKLRGIHEAFINRKVVPGKANPSK